MLRLLLKVTRCSPQIRNVATTSYRWSFKSTDASFMNELLENETDTEVTSQISSLVDALQPVSGGKAAFVVQPFIKWGPLKRRDTTPQLQLEESVSLINTLNDWSIQGKEIVSLYSFDKQSFFGSGKLEELKSKICHNNRITAMFISVDMLSANQHMFLEECFGVPVYDRYLIVMQIFREHAISNEAKLQIALAEVPYLQSRMSHVYGSALSRIGGSAGRISGTTIHTPPDTRKMILHKYEAKLKSSLDRVRQHRNVSRNHRKSLERPTVAVVGYTNAGKTSLIKKLTGSQKLEPKNYLFATLDVTFHIGHLPCNLKVFYIDTIGFISDIPTRLIEPFRVTLSDAMFADLIVHVQDISHPDWQYQRDKVKETLKTINLEGNLLKHVVNVANKSDLLPKDHGKILPDNTIETSCVTGQGIEDLKETLLDKLIEVTGRQHLIIRAKTGGDEMRWLHENAAIADVAADEKNVNYSLISVIITQVALDKFRNTFIR